ncbi:hypothetical protein HMF8227_03000 [Saliniradius amylolyticus]|uniref:DnaT DNA-binding domain-containing protein n=1 Tax=Saliniradius amylolyticus TaxID=2183582 RepID=A0A2S2E724_9ALTE|nr:DnaT-like ssDNA-binding domain-containing protein [Saliniradius amylolyticus]AWL13448.1 hypothetical protein HMF8227_03000 [Saliniradius amylolyticus]
MNGNELTALQSALSNEARVLYMLCLRPGANTHSGKTKAINYRACMDRLNAHTQVFERGRQINQLLRELADAGLVATDKDLHHSINGESVILPLLATANDDYAHLHQQWVKMHTRWQPDPALFNELATMVGLADKQFQQDQLGEFVAYWMGRPETVLTPFQWTQKFVLQLKRHQRPADKKTAESPASLTNNTPGVAVDDNARKLVEKYHGQTRRQD